MSIEYTPGIPRRLTVEDLAFAHQVRYRERMLHAWMRRTRRGNSYWPEDVPGYIEPPTNGDRSRAEVIEFCARPLPYGQTYTAYLTRLATGGWAITTWPGDTLATVTSITFRRVAGPMTDTRGSFWARGIDGRLYYGRHSGTGMYCGMRLAKHQ